MSGKASTVSSQCAGHVPCKSAGHGDGLVSWGNDEGRESRMINLEGFLKKLAMRVDWMGKPNSVLL